MQTQLRKQIDEMKLSINQAKGTNQYYISGSNGIAINLTAEESTALNNLFKDFEQLNIKISQIETEINGMKSIFDKIIDGSLMHQLFNDSTMVQQTESFRLLMDRVNQLELLLNQGVFF